LCVSTSVIATDKVHHAWRKLVGGGRTELFRRATASQSSAHARTHPLLWGVTRLWPKLKMTSLVDGIQLAQVIRELKDHIGINWKAVARELEFTTTDVDAIVCRDEHDLKEQIHRFFEQWKMREGSGASVQKLIEAVRAAGLRTILDDLQRALPELECGGIMPVQETAPTGGTPTSERDLVRMKRLQKMSISDDPSFQPSSSPGGPRRSASSQTAAKNSEPSPIKAGVSSSFEVGQVVKVDHKPKPWYGVIKYIGPVTDCPGTFAGVEMDEVVEGGHAGKFGGKRYFTCNDGYGLMLPLSRLKLDDRFDPPTLKGGSVGGDDVERDKNMPSTPTQPTASRKPSDPLSPDLMKGDAAKPTQKEMPGVFESTDSPETSGKFVFLSNNNVNQCSSVQVAVRCVCLPLSVQEMSLDLSLGETGRIAEM
jgi:hypothetical protein